MDLRHIKIASPCPVRWEDMEGDDRSRFCRHCSKSVYNFTGMSAAEIDCLIREKKGKVCARLYQRPDGKILLENCPRGIGRLRPGFRITAAAMLGFVIYAASLIARRTSDLQSVDAAVAARARMDEAVWAVKGWFGITRPQMMLGEICPVPVTPASTVVGTNDPACLRE